MEKELKNTHIFILLLILITSLMVIFNVLIISKTIENMPTNFDTNHYIEIDMDNETKAVMDSIKQIQEIKFKENYLFCENKLLEQQIYYEKIINNYEKELVVCSIIK